MRYRFIKFGFVIVTSVVIAVLLPAGTPMAGQATIQLPAYRAPRFPGTQNPNLNGYWQAFNTASWDLQPHAAGPAPFPALTGAIGAMPPGIGVVEGNEIPYRPEMLAKKKENFEKRFNRPIDVETNSSTGDPEAKCYLPGVPRATYMGPFQIIQTAKQILLSYQYANATRIVFMDRKPPIPADTWMGISIGRWEGDTLVIDVTNQLDRTWLDRAGDFHSDAIHVTERYTPISPYHIQYEATIEDPKVFTRPWKISMPLYKSIEKNVQMLEFKCVEFSEEFMYGHFIEPSK